MVFSLGARSLSRLDGLRPDLVEVTKAAIITSAVDFTVIEGIRSKHEMCVNWGKGRSPAECIAHGVPAEYSAPQLGRVTWLADPFKSKHGVQADGFGHAVDLAPWVNGAIDWNTASLFEAIATAMKSAAASRGVAITWGGDWSTSKDLPHFEVH